MASFLCPFPLLIFKQIQICTLAQSHDFSVDFLYVYVSKSKSVLRLNPMIFLLITWVHQKRSKSVLQLSPIFFLSNSAYTFNEIQICTSANPIFFSANFLYKKIYANPNLYFDSNPSVFSLIPQYTMKSKSVLQPSPFFCLFYLYIYRQIQICTLALTIIFKQIQKQHMNNIL